MKIRQSIFKQIYFFLQLIRKEPIQSTLKDLNISLYSDILFLKNIQFTRLKECLIHAIEHVPYYKDSYKTFKEEIYNLNDWDDCNILMERLPVLRKQDFINNRSTFFSDDIHLRKTYQNKTSGSMGNPVIYPCDQLSWAYRHAAVYRSLKIFNIDIGEPYAYFFGQHWSGKLKVRMKDFVFNRVRVNAFDLNLENTPYYYHKLKRRKVTHFIGYPNTITEFLVNCKHLNLDLSVLPLKLIVTTAETLTDENKKLIESIAKVPCADQYGCAEAGIIACAGVEGYMHLTMENVWFRTDMNGNIYVTDLFLRSCPLINYEIGDKSGGIVENHPELKQKHFVIKNILGRTQEDIILSNGKIINSHIPNYIFKNVGDDWGIVKFRFYFLKNSNKVRLYIKVLSALSADQLDSIYQSSKLFFGNDVELEVFESESFPVLPNAKHRIMVVLNSFDEIKLN